MIRRKLALAAGLLAILAARPGLADTPAPAKVSLSIAEAENLALKQSPDLAVSEKSVAAAEANLGSTKASRWPSLSATASVLYWNEPIEVEFAIPGMMPPPGTEPSTITVRGQITTQAQVTATLPITSQWIINESINADAAALDAARATHTTSRLDVALGAAQGATTLLLARAATDIAKARVAEVEAQIARAKVLADGGVLGRVDVMRLEAALATARQQLIRAQAQAAGIQDRLAFVLGLSPGTAIAVKDTLADPPPPPSLSPDQAAHAAIAQRPEVDASRAQAVRADSGADAARIGLFPQIAAIATVQESGGGGAFAEPFSWFVGLQASWNIWTWGREWKAVDAAGIRATRAALAADRLADRVAVEARNQARTARAAHDAIAVASTGLAAAEEAYRIQQARYAEGATTTTDLLSAETDVSRARIGYATARYSYMLELAKLARATGQLPSALLPVTR